MHLHTRDYISQQVLFLETLAVAPLSCTMLKVSRAYVMLVASTPVHKGSHYLTHMQLYSTSSIT